MPIRNALLLVPLLLPTLVATARAAPFDDLKADLATCLRFELDGARAQRIGSANAGAGFAIRKCATEIERLDRADPRRLRGDRGISPSTRSVLDSVLATGGRGRASGPPR